MQILSNGSICNKNLLPVKVILKRMSFNGTTNKLKYEQATFQKSKYEGTRLAVFGETLQSRAESVLQYAALNESFPFRLICKHSNFKF